MGRVIGLAILLAAVALAFVVGQRMSSDAMAVVVGVVFGVAASIPTSLLVVAATRQRRDEGYRRQDELRAPPQVIVVQPQPMPPAPPMLPPAPDLRRWGELNGAEDAVWTMVGEE